MATEVAILGATGVVGQKVIALLQQQSSEFFIGQLYASTRRAGKRYGEGVAWRESLAPLSERVANLVVIDDPEQIRADRVISCLPSGPAKALEVALAEQGKMVFSNASAWRMAPHVPLLIPEINLNQLSWLAQQPYRGGIITNPNCAAVGIALGLAPLMTLGTLDHVGVVTMQALSGAGYPGVPSLDILGNTVPHIPHEAEKIEEETKKILGVTTGSVPDFALTAQVHRVPVCHGHLVTLQVTFQQAVDLALAKAAFEQWNQRFPDLYQLYPKLGEPQAARHLRHDDMRVHIGHLKQGGRSNVLNLIVLTHNLVRGAAGAAIANLVAFEREQVV